METEKIEQNKLIDLFMAEFEEHEGDRLNIVNDLNVRGCDPQKFHDSWDLLMPVVQKCYDVISPLLDTGENHKDENLVGDISTELLDGRITNCHQAVVKAIVYYNEQQKQEQEEEVQEPEVFEIDEDLYEVLDPKYDMKQITESAKNCKLVLFNKETGHAFATTGSMHNFPDTEKFTLALERNKRSRVIIEIQGGVAECWGGHSEVDVEIRDYDVNDAEADNDSFFNDHNGDIYERRIF